MRTLYQSRRGYTIIELLVALSIAAIFFTSFFAVVATTLETLRTGDERTVAQQNARIALSSMATELRNMVELEPRSTYEARDPGLPGLPRSGTSRNALLTNVNAWPVLARSSDDSTTGYITLTHEDAAGGSAQYADFRDDGRPFDLRPLSPNRLSARLGNPYFFGNTRYVYLNPQTGGATSVWDLDDSSAIGGGTTDNPTAADMIITYEHQVTPPRVAVYDVLPATPAVYDYILDGLVKRLYVMTGTGGTPLVLDTDSVNLAAGGVAERPSLSANYVPEFYLLRSFHTASPPNVFSWQPPSSLQPAPSGLGGGARGNGAVRLPPVHLRQPIADHIIDLRFRYWFTSGSRLIEVRYDPEVANMAVGGGGLPDVPQNGYYRYFDVNGNEIYVWSRPGTGRINVDEADYLSDPQDYIDSYPSQTFICTNEFERGLLLFEGWRLINAVSITLRAANKTVLTEYVNSIDFTTGVTPGDPEWGYGFTDLGGSNFTENSVNQLYRAVDNTRGGYFDPVTATVINPGTVDSFDIIEPLASTNFDPTRFVTLQTFVAPPLLKERSEEFQGGFRAAFSVTKIDIE